ncbi:MAG: galactose-1-phosphate uridylyltransferase [Actinobacteria bacterium]|uniref:UDP-glucose--hexose-1-phosphate uridylyltransferase n=1 Tax=freshwater metagenome TaxID=449393 RepID=A0A6J6P711_9ZZZZ|nr:galactose-1-phosphate uridylyltransferase [Actinomycetota bacterium]
MSSEKSIPLSKGIVRQDRKLSDGRTISYYDSKSTSREAVDTRPIEKRPSLGELRLDALTNEWVVMAAHRQARAFLPPKELCPLCPTKPGLQSEIPESKYEVVVFENLSPSLAQPSVPWNLPALDGLNTPIVDAAGFCEVLCYTDDHEANFGSLSLEQIRIVMEAWRDRTREISKMPHIAHIFPFENRGVEVGVTLHHPHGQIYAYSYLPPRVEKMLKVATDYFSKNSRPLISDIIAREITDEVRIVAQNSDWIAYVPFASRYPFEIHIAPKIFTADLAQLTDAQADSFGAVAKESLQRLDGVFGIEMAYMAAWHQAPVNIGRDVLGLHMQITSIRRAPGKLKYLAGSESAMQAFIMDMKPEQSAAQLRGVEI